MTKEAIKKYRDWKAEDNEAEVDLRERLCPQFFFSLLKRTTVQESGCITLDQNVTSQGYARIQIGKKYFQAHRVIWRLFRGDIPSGMTIDHLCMVRNCVNPMHLAVASQLENSLRSGNATGKNSKKTHCNRGHPYPPYVPYQERNCPICTGARARAARGRSARKRKYGSVLLQALERAAEERKNSGLPHTFEEIMGEAELMISRELKERVVGDESKTG